MNQFWRKLETLLLLDQIDHNSYRVHTILSRLATIIDAEDLKNVVELFAQEDLVTMEQFKQIRDRSDPQVVLTYHFIGNVGQLTGTYTGDSLSIGDFRSVISFCLPAAVWPFDNFFDLGYFPYINVLKI